MSGHSKWHNIQVRKGKMDAVRGAAFTKLTRAITIAARQGGGDAESNFALRFAIEKAKEASLPKDKIERAIAAGTGALKDAAQIEEVVYEGFGPGKCAVMVAVATDNKNRTLGELKKIFSNHGGALGAAGAVAWQFSEMGVARVVSTLDDAAELALIDAGVEDILRGEDSAAGGGAGTIEIRTNKQKLFSVIKALGSLGVEGVSGKLEWVPKETIKLAPEDEEKLHALFVELDAYDDVQEFFTNAV